MNAVRGLVVDRREQVLGGDPADIFQAHVDARQRRPLVLPGIATTALYAFLFSWTEFLGALSFLTNDSLFTLPVALSNVETGTYGAVNYGLLLAGAVIAMVPCVVVYVGLQRYYVPGLVSGALKG
jgi:multiple sugar transport system permease protein